MPKCFEFTGKVRPEQREGRSPGAALDRCGQAAGEGADRGTHRAWRRRPPARPTPTTSRRRHHVRAVEPSPGRRERQLPGRLARATVSNSRDHEAIDDLKRSRKANGFLCDFVVHQHERRRLSAPARKTSRPRIYGPQTATVVGASGNEIETDKHGRIKIQFHWDRIGKKDENSSCWVRVAQPWAGKGYGMFSLPRVGHEVVVQFLDGDPDRPLVTGSVYNNDNMLGLEAARPLDGQRHQDAEQQGGHGQARQRAALRRQEGQRVHLVPRREGLPPPGRARRLRLDRQQRVGQGRADAQGSDRRELVHGRHQGCDAQPGQGPARQRRRRHLLHRRRRPTSSSSTRTTAPSSAATSASTWAARRRSSRAATSCCSRPPASCRSRPARPT